MNKTVKPRRKGGLTNTALVRKVREWAGLDADVKQINARKTEIRDELMSAVERFGVEDDAGHGWLELPEPIEGIKSLKREKAVSQSIDSDALLAYLKKHNLTDCITTVEVVDEDALWAAVYDKSNRKVTEKVIEDFTTTRVTYRFIPTREMKR